ncbi:gamma-glutamyltransferase [Mariniblastus sp.]|nr:gamma-glutamyltransferase [Mariniblastus sp.]
MPNLRPLITWLLLCSAVTAFLTSSRLAVGQDESYQGARGKNGAIATGSKLAAEAGLGMLRSGGNAADAATATMLVQTVVEARLFCFGSEVPIIVYDSKRDVVEVIVGLGAAPELATREWFIENRGGVIQGRGDIANCVVPGFLDAVLTLLQRYGTRSFENCSKPMLAELKRRSEMSLEAVNKQTKSKSDAVEWIKHHKNFHRLITRLVEAEKAAGKDRLSGLQAVHDYFYRGPIAEEIDAWSRKNGGLLRYADFANHQTRIDQPRSIEFRGHTIYKCDVWTQGPCLLQTLNLLADRDLEKMDRDSADYIHLVTEAMKLGFADRDAFYGDPTFVEVPIQQLLSSDYTALRRPLIKMDTASQVQQPGDPIKMKSLLGVPPKDYKVVSGFSEDTSNCLVADKWGNVIAATPSGWGGVPAGDTGVQLGSRMIGLVTWKDHPSMVQPGKRPRITLTPTLVMRDGKPVFAVSVAGGDRQDQASIQILLNRLVFGFDPATAVRSPRFSTGHHIDWFGHMKAKLGTLTVTKDTSKTIINELKTRGHEIGTGRTAGASVVLAIDPETGEKHAAADRGKVAVGY